MQITQTDRTRPYFIKQNLMESELFVRIIVLQYLILYFLENTQFRKFVLCDVTCLQQIVYR